MSSSSSSSSTSQYERFLAEDVLYHKASTPISEMPSCTDMFDRWASCFALGPQLKAVYRYGGVQDCKEKMDDFKHCLTMKGMTQEEKYEEWITRKAERTAEKRLGKGSAENVWVLRRDPNEEGVQLDEQSRQEERVSISPPPPKDVGILICL